MAHLSPPVDRDRRPWRQVRNQWSLNAHVEQLVQDPDRSVISSEYTIKEAVKYFSFLLVITKEPSG